MTNNLLTSDAAQTDERICEAPDSPVECPILRSVVVTNVYADTGICDPTAPQPDCTVRLLRTRFDLDNNGSCLKQHVVDYVVEQASLGDLYPLRRATGIEYAGTDICPYSLDGTYEIPLEIRERMNKLISNYQLDVSGFDLDKTYLELTMCEPTKWKNIPVTLADLVVNPGDRLRGIIRHRVAPTMIIRHNPLPDNLTIDLRERRARQTLRRMLGDRQYYLFRRKGFISLLGKSGLVYQIFPGREFTRVYCKGKQIESLCVIFNADYPPTDSLIMRLVLILNDESIFRKMANVHQPQHGFYNADGGFVNNDLELCNTLGKAIQSIKQRSLLEVWDNIKRSIA